MKIVRAILPMIFPIAALTLVIILALRWYKIEGETNHCGLECQCKQDAQKIDAKFVRFFYYREPQCIIKKNNEIKNIW